MTHLICECCHAELPVQPAKRNGQNSTHPKADELSHVCLRITELFWLKETFKLIKSKHCPIAMSPLNHVPKVFRVPEHQPSPRQRDIHHSNPASLFQLCDPSKSLPRNFCNLVFTDCLGALGTKAQGYLEDAPREKLRPGRHQLMG